MLPQRKCKIQSHNDQQIIGICQNAQCKQLSRQVCFQCVEELHQNDQGYQISDIVSKEYLNDILQNFQQKSIERNEKIQKTCQINKFLLLKEFEEFLSFWKLEYNTWNYLEQISQKFTDNNKLITIDSYIDNQPNKYNLKQYLKTLAQEAKELVDEILSKNYYDQHQQKINQLNNEPIENIDKILTNLSNQVKQNTKMEKDDMLNFIFHHLQNHEMAVSMVQKMQYYYKTWNKKRIKIYKQDDYSQKQICRKGMLLLSLHKVEEALNFFDLLIDQFPENIQAHYHKSLILKDQENFKDLIECLDLCIKLNPNHEYAYFQKAYILKKQENFKDAIECLDLCIKSNPNCGYAYYYNKAVILEDQKNFKKAIECLDQFIQLYPNDENVFNISSKINRIQKKLQNDYKNQEI